VTKLGFWAHLHLLVADISGGSHALRLRAGFRQIPGARMEGKRSGFIAFINYYINTQGLSKYMYKSLIINTQGWAITFMNH